MMIKARNLFCLIVCGIGAFYLASSEMDINSFAAGILGSSTQSAKAAEYVAVGVVFALMVLGSIAIVTKSKFMKKFVGVVSVVTIVFSALLTIVGQSIDAEANDNSGQIQNFRQKTNAKKMNLIEKASKSLNGKMDECAHDKYFGPCSGTETSLVDMVKTYSDVADDSMKSKQNQEIDITKAIYNKVGLNGEIVERVLIILRAIVASALIYILMYGFWMFFDLLWGHTGKKSEEADQGGSASSNAVENMLNGKHPVTTPQKTKTKAKTTTPRPANVVDIKSQSSTPQTTPQKAPLPNRSRSKPRGSKDRSVSGVPGEKSKIALPNNLDSSKLTDGERFAVVEYLIQRKSINPSFKAITSLGIGSTNAQKYLGRLRTRGTIVKGGRGHTLTDSRFISEPVAKFEKLIRAA